MHEEEITECLRMPDIRGASTKTNRTNLTNKTKIKQKNIFTFPSITVRIYLVNSDNNVPDIPQRVVKQLCYFTTEKRRMIFRAAPLRFINFSQKNLSKLRKYGQNDNRIL